MAEKNMVAGQSTSSTLDCPAGQKWVEALPRLGYFVHGLLYATVGFLALQVALGAGGSTTDFPGAIAAVGAQRLGKVTLVFVAIGLAGYSLWGFVRAFLDPLGRGTGLKALAERGGYVVSGLTYAALVLPTVRLILGAGQGGETDKNDWTAWLLAQPYGAWLVGLVGIIAIIGSLGQVYQSVSASFKKDFKQEQMSEREMTWAVRIGRFGLAARGVVFALLGFFMLQSTWHAASAQVRGLDGALLALARQQQGPLLLGTVALGLMAFGVFSVLCAKWIKIVQKKSG